MNLLLIVVRPRSAVGKEIPVQTWPFVIGRDPKCDLHANHQTVSRRHCSLDLRDDGVFVTDLKSANGTTVNGEPVKRARKLRNGDTLQAGALEVVVRLKSDTAADKPPTVHSGIEKIFEEIASDSPSSKRSKKHSEDTPALANLVNTDMPRGPGVTPAPEEGKPNEPVADGGGESAPGDGDSRP